MGTSIGFILAGGIGARFGGEKPKQYHTINGKEILAYSIEAFRKSKYIDDFFIVLDEEVFLTQRIEKDYGVTTIMGGKSRNHSFKNALDYIKLNYPECEKVIENEAARPLITNEIIDSYLELLDEYDYVNTTVKISDALGSFQNRVADRSQYYLIQAPDAYRFQLLYESFDPESDTIHPAFQLPNHATEYRNFNFGNNIKVTYPQDLMIVEAILKSRIE